MKLELYFQRDIEGQVIVDEQGNEVDTIIVLDGVARVLVTYSDLVRVEFESIGAAEEAADKTGWEFWEEDMLDMRFEGSMVKVGDKYFADWSVEEDTYGQG
jgi:hypothetical protein